MKNIIYIGFLAIVLLFSCSKEQPLSPISPSRTVESTEFTGNTFLSFPNSGVVIFEDSDSGDTDITDPEQEGKEKTNKKTKL